MADGSVLGSTISKDRTYWVLGEDQELADEAMARVKGFAETHGQKPFAQRIERNFRYFYNLYDRFWNQGQGSQEVGIGGEDGQLDLITLNHFRSIIQNILNIATRDRPAYESKARNAEQKSLDRAILSNNLLEYYDDERDVGTVLYTAAEQAMIFLVSYVYITWDPDIGAEVGADESGSMLYEGDLSVKNRTIFDLTYDTTIREWKDVPWVIVRSWVNKWDLAAQFPDFEEEILGTPADLQPYEEIFQFGHWGTDKSKSDQVPIFEFYHKKTASVPAGKYQMIAAGKPLLTLPLPYKALPIERMTAGDVINTTFGYSPGIDIQGCSEAINALASIVLTAHGKLGLPYLWSDPNDEITTKQLDGGLTNVKSVKKPEALLLGMVSPELPVALNFFIQSMQLITGVSDVMRGVLPSSRLSGTAMALLESKSVQFQNAFIKHYYDLIGNVGTKIIRTLEAFVKTERVLSVVGKYNKPRLLSFTGDTLADIDRVTIRPGNALARTPAGKLEIANQLATNGWVRTGQEYLTVLQTGNLDPILKADTAQLDKIRTENERLGEGQQVQALWTDNQVLHIREHAAEIFQDDPPEITSVKQAHILEHLQLWYSPEVQDLQKLLGYPLTPPGMSVPQAGYASPPPVPGIGGPPPEAGPPPPGGAPKEAAIPGPEEIPNPPVRPAKLPQPPQVPQEGAPNA